MGSKFQKYFASIARGIFFPPSESIASLRPNLSWRTHLFFQEGVLLELYFCKVMMLRCVFFALFFGGGQGRGHFIWVFPKMVVPSNHPF